MMYPVLDQTQLALAPTLDALPGQPRKGIDRLASMGFRFVQLSATQRGMRPRELDGSARRDLAALLRRHELAPSGIDLWVPASHFADSTYVDRAVAATMDAIGLSGDLDRCPISMTLPELEDATAREAVQAVLDAAHHAGVPLADHRYPIADRSWDQILGVGIDPAAILAAGGEPAKEVSRNSGVILAARLSDLMTTGLRGPIGTDDGRLDAVGYKVALSIAGFSRPVTADLRQWPHPWIDLRLTAERWAAATDPSIGRA